MSIDGSKNHVPGYRGFVPRIREEYGRTYGKTTRDALSSKIDGPNSPFPPSHPDRPRPALPSLVTDPPVALRAQTMPLVFPPKSAAQSASDEKDTAKTKTGQLPGYGGYLSIHELPIGKTFGQASEAANNEREKRAQSGRDRHEAIMSKDFLGEEEALLQLPENTIFKPNQVDWKPEIDQSKDHRPPGYTGFTPGSQHHFGTSYGDMTRYAKQSPEQRWPYGGRETDVNVSVKDSTEVNDPRATGDIVNRHEFSKHLPGYTGFIRQSKDDYSRTYGHETQERLRDLRAEQRVLHTKHQEEKDYLERLSHENAQPIPFRTSRPQPTDDPNSHGLLLPEQFQPHQKPGYTGYVHRTNHTLGLTYSEMTRQIYAQDASLQGASGPSPNPLDANRPQSLANTHPLDKTDLEGGSAQHHDYHSPFYSTMDMKEPTWQPYSPTRRTLGYGGYRPGNKYTHAVTYGKSTEQTEGRLDGRPRPSSTSVLPPSPRHNRPPTPPSSRSQMSSSPPLPPPGYTGFLPHKQHIYASTYGQISRYSQLVGPTLVPSRAIAGEPTEGEARGESRAHSQGHQLEEGQSNSHNDTRPHSMPPVQPSHSLNQSLEPHHPSHLPGYTGYVPGYYMDHGHTYGQLTRSNIDKFDQKRLTS